MATLDIGGQPYLPLPILSKPACGSVINEYGINENTKEDVHIIFIVVPRRERGKWLKYNVTGWRLEENKVMLCNSLLSSRMSRTQGWNCMRKPVPPAPRTLVKPSSAWQNIHPVSMAKEMEFRWLLGRSLENKAVSLRQPTDRWCHLILSVDPPATTSYWWWKWFSVKPGSCPQMLFQPIHLGNDIMKVMLERLWSVLSPELVKPWRTESPERLTLTSLFLQCGSSNAPFPSVIWGSSHVPWQAASGECALPLPLSHSSHSSPPGASCTPCLPSRISGCSCISPRQKRQRCKRSDRWPCLNRRALSSVRQHLCCTYLPVAEGEKWHKVKSKII